MNKFLVIMSAATAFVIGAGGALTVAFVTSKGNAIGEAAWALSMATGLVVAAKDVRSLLKLPPVSGDNEPPNK